MPAAPVDIRKPEDVTGVTCTMRVLSRDKDNYRVFVRATAKNTAASTDSYVLQLWLFSEQQNDYVKVEDGPSIVPNETLIYTFNRLVPESPYVVDNKIKAKVVMHSMAQDLEGLAEADVAPLRGPPNPPPNRQGSRPLSGGSIAIADDTEEFSYYFDEYEAFGVYVGVTTPPWPGDVWLQIMYWDDDFQDWELLYEQLNASGSSSYWASRGYDFRNIADYTIKAKLIGQTTLQATKTITPNYDPPELANGTVVTRDPMIA